MTWRDFWSKVVVKGEDECWVWRSTMKDNGYGTIRIKGKDFYAHRISWELEYGLIPYSMHVLHECIGTRSCVNPYHLYIGTPLDNMRDMVNQGRSMKGENHPNSKLTSNQVREIKRRLRYQIEKDSKLSIEYGISDKQMSKIKLGQRWEHIR